MRLFPRRVWKKALGDLDADRRKAEEAVEESRVNLEDTLSTRVEVNRVTSRLARIREEDHFAEQVRLYIVGEG